MRTIIIGHRQPDLDSITASLVYAEFLKKTGKQNIVAGYADIINDETKYVLGKFKIDSPLQIKEGDVKDDDEIILVDHNEESQRLPGINPNQVIAIIDHHKASVNFNQPIEIDIRPWGSTSTIIYDRFLKNNLEVKGWVAQLLLSAILSDTVGLKSATTTDLDREIAKKLAKITSLNLNDLTFEIFKAKSKIDHLTPLEVVTKDYKVFDFGGKKVFINQIETVEQEKALKQKEKLIEAMKAFKEENDVDLVFCLITDILKANSRLLFTNDQEREAAKIAFDGKEEGEGVFDIGKRLSRKKEVAPFIEKAI